MRILKDEYYMEVAKAVAGRSTCLRRQYGAVIVNNDEIIATGYNGSVRGVKNCCDIGFCYRQKHNIPHGTCYELCRAVHAEMNAVISAARRDMIGGTLYLYGTENGNDIEVMPCLMCWRVLWNAGIEYLAVNNKEAIDVHRLEIVAVD